MSEIDELGSSLLNRQRDTRKRTEKRLRRDTRNQAVLNVAAKGMQLANSALKNRADTFVNENEELIGQKMLYNKALRNKERLLEEYDLAQAHPAGELDWLASTKFAPIIKNNLESTFNTSGFSKRDTDRWVNEQALEEAKKYQGSWNKSIDEALKMGSIDDYNAYISSNDGRAENVGGFLFNKISRSLNNKTQADVDKEILTSFKNSRFSKNAEALNYFEGLTKVGLNHNVAKDLTIKNGNLSTNPDRLKSLEGLGIKPSDIINTKITPLYETVYKGGVPYSVPVIKYEYLYDDGSTKEVIGPRTKLNENEETVIVQPKLWRMYEGSQEENSTLISSSISVTDPLGDNNTESIINAGLKTGDYIAGTARKAGEQSIGRYNRKGTKIEVPIYLNETGQMEQGKEIYTQSYIEFDQDLTFDEKFGNIEASYVSEAKAALQRVAGTLPVPNETKSILELDLINRYFAGSEERYQDLKDEGTDFGVLFSDNITALSKYIAIDAEKYEMDFKLDRGDALELATASHLSSMATGWRSDTETVVEDDNAISAAEFPASSILYAISTLDASTTSFDIEPKRINDVVKDSFLEVTQLFSIETPETTALATKIATTVLDIEGIENVRISENSFKDSSIVDELEAAGVNPINNENDIGEFTVAQIFNFSMKLPQGEIQRPSSNNDNEGLEINLDNYRGTNRIPENDVITPILRSISNTFKSINEKSEAQQALVKLRNSYIEEGLNANPPLSRVEATIYADDMMKSEGNNIPK